MFRQRLLKIAISNNGSAISDINNSSIRKTIISPEAHSRNAVYSLSPFELLNQLSLMIKNEFAQINSKLDQLEQLMIIRFRQDSTFEDKPNNSTVAINTRFKTIRKPSLQDSQTILTIKKSS